MDYPVMQDQPRARPLSLGKYRLDPRRRAILVGGLMALAGAAIVLRPPNRTTAPTQGNDFATLAKLVNLPAVPISVRWTVAPMGAVDSEPAPGSSDWSLDVTLVFAPSDAKRVTGADVFYKPPLLAGKLVRLDDTHFHLILNTQ
jgi:hypothetical protein